MNTENPLSHLGRDIRVYNALIDALIAGLMAGAIYQWKVEAAVIGAIRRENAPIKDRVSTQRDRRAEEMWGVTARDPDRRVEQIFNAAGLSEKQAEVAFWFFDRGMTPADMARDFGGDLSPEERAQLAVRYGAHLQWVREKLQGLGKRFSGPAPSKNIDLSPEPVFIGYADRGAGVREADLNYYGRVQE